ncbi:conserved hypothetical protein [Cyanobium sp. PCC 7001]|uniref:hypothetical protein n=1 Tax=Cyanobium sp. PCC 7001 TaxID=180281 RepID=UPI000180551D|nr:hypothetical protein [Cyanobium sp. PCC 7001]EDY39022.1 conserved hypothetical protein [Cyanobium sp. PCC 7001]
MARYVCPYCRPRPLAMFRRSDGVWICARCGDPLQRVPLVRPLSAIAGLAVAVGLGVALLPLRRLIPEPLAAGVPARLLQATEPLTARQGPTGLVGIDEASLLRELEVADAAWIPRAERLPDGRTRYHYQRRVGEPQLSLAEIRRRIADPPRFHSEQAAISQLIGVLGQAGVRIQLAQPRKSGAAAEWDPGARTLRIKPKVMASGSSEFAQVLNHEAIHVAQSCSRGNVRAAPRLLGLNTSLPPHLNRVLAEAVYASASPEVKLLEREAYANQHQLDLGARLVRQHCRLAESARSRSVSLTPRGSR